MKLQDALARINNELVHGDNHFAILKNINTGRQLVIGTSYDGEPLVLEYLGLTKEEWAKADTWYDLECDELPEFVGTNLEHFKYTVEEVVDHHYGILYAKECPLTYANKASSTVYRAGYCNPQFFI